MSENFGTIVVCDFEYEVEPGDLPDVLCMVAHVLDENLQHVRTIRLWCGEFGPTPPFDIGPGTLFVAYSAWAEMTCFKVLGWRSPVHIFDQHTAYLAASNVLLPHSPDEVRKKPRKRLPYACRAYGLEGWERIDKDTIEKAIGDGSWREHYSPEEILDYCEEDVRMEVRLLRAQLCGRPGLLPADVPHVLHWSNYSAKCIALIQARGMPIDMELWNLVQENKSAVIGELLRRFDPSHDDEDPIYTPEGEWSYQRFEQWLVQTGVIAWPRLDSGRLNIDSDAFRMMYSVPGIEGLHALRDSLGFIVKARLPIGSDGRNRPSLFPIRHRHRQERTRQVTVQRTCRYARIHDVSTGYDRRLPRLAHAGSRRGRRIIRRPHLDGRLCRRRHLSRLSAAMRPHPRSGSGALEEDQP